MTLASTSEFLIWAALRDVVLDDRYHPPQCLVYRNDTGRGRFWEKPKSMFGLRRFVTCLLDGLGTWEECGLWRRGGRWPETGLAGSWFGPAVDFVAVDHEGGVLARSMERASVLRVINRLAARGGFVADDLFVIPDHGRAFLYVDHHDVVHASFASETVMNTFIEHMAAAGFALPVELPDATFKEVAWMKGTDGPRAV